MRGVIYAHAGTSCLARLIVSLHSLRKHWDGPVTVFQEDKAVPELHAICRELGVDITEYPPVAYNKYTKKCDVNLRSGYKASLYLDADTLVCGDLTQFFEWIEQHGLVFTNFCNWTPKGGLISGRMRKWKDLYPEELAVALQYPVALNTGVYGFVKDHPFLDGWLKTSEVGGNNGVPLTDELAAQLLCPFFKHFVAPVEWNYSVRFGEDLKPLQEARVIHYHGRKHVGDNNAQKLWRAELEEAHEKYGMQSWGDRRVRRVLRHKDSTFKLPLAPVVDATEKWVDVDTTEKWVDVVTTAVPRETVGRALGSMLDHLDKKDYKLRWLVNLDKVDSLSEWYESTKQQIMELGKQFDDFKFFEGEGNHVKALYKLFEHVQHDIILWEDDRITSTQFDLDQIYAQDKQYVSFQRKAVNAGHLSCSFWKKEVVDHCVAKPPRNWNEDAETWTAGRCYKAFSRGCHRLLTAPFNGTGDIGFESLGQKRMIRLNRSEDGDFDQIIYQKSDERITWVTCVDRNYLRKFRRNYVNWVVRLYIQSYDMIVFYDDSIDPAVDLSFMLGSPRFIKWDMPVSDSQREKMLSAFILGTAEHVKTPYWIKIDSDVSVNKATRDIVFWKKYENNIPEILGHKWGYTKPKGGEGDKHWLNILDDWWISLHPNAKPLYPANIPSTKIYRHKRMASFVCLQSTDLTKKVAAMCGSRLPIPSHDTVMWYVADQLNVFRVREDMKKKGFAP